MCNQNGGAPKSATSGQVGWGGPQQQGQFKNTNQQSPGFFDFSGGQQQPTINAPAAAPAAAQAFAPQARPQGTPARPATPYQAPAAAEVFNPSRRSTPTPAAPPSTGHLPYTAAPTNQVTDRNGIGLGKPYGNDHIQTEVPAGQMNDFISDRIDPRQQAEFRALSSQDQTNYFNGMSNNGGQQPRPTREALDRRFTQMRDAMNGLRDRATPQPIRPQTPRQSLAARQEVAGTQQQQIQALRQRQQAAGTREQQQQKLWARQQAAGSQQQQREALQARQNDPQAAARYRQQILANRRID